MKKVNAPLTKQKKVTLHDVAKEAGVSVATVSNVLNSTGSVGQLVKARVSDTVRKLNYRTNHSARAMKTGKTKTLGLVVPDITNPFFSKLAQSIEEIAREKGYSVLLIDARIDTYAEEEGIRHLFQYGVDGIVWCPLSSKDTIAEFAPGIPTVVVDRPISKYDSVSSNYMLAEQLLADYAIEQGHKRIGIACGPKNLESAELRKQSFLDHLNGRAEVVWIEENAYSLSLNFNLKKRALSNKASLIVAGNDLIAIGIISLLKESGVGVPDDVSVLGFDDTPWCNLISPKLTSIRQPISEMGQKAINILLSRIEEPAAAAQNIMLDVSLSVRDSVIKLS